MRDEQRNPEDEPISELLAEVMDLIDQVVDRLCTPEHVEAQMAAVLWAGGYYDDLFGLS